MTFSDMNFSKKTTWDLLSQEEIEHLWKYLAQEARSLTVITKTNSKRHNNADRRYTALRSAIAQIKRAATGTRAVGINVTATQSDGYRQMSGKDLQEAVLKYREKLFDYPDTEVFFEAGIEGWTKLHKGAVLNAMHIASHDEAAGAACQQAEAAQAPPEAVAQQSEASAAKHHVVLPDLAPSPLPPLSAELSPVLVVDSALLRELTHDMAALRNKLLQAAQTLASEGYPEETQTIRDWQSLGERIRLACHALGTSWADLPALRLDLARAESQAAVIAILAQCRQIVHCDKPDFAGLKVISNQCDRIEALLREGSAAVNELKGASALLELVEKRELLDQLDEVYAGELSSAVCAVFDKSVEIAAVRAKLLPGPALPPPGAPERGGPERVGVMRDEATHPEALPEPPETPEPASANAAETETQMQTEAMPDTKHAALPTPTPTPTPTSTSTSTSTSTPTPTPTHPAVAVADVAASATPDVALNGLAAIDEPVPQAEQGVPPDASLEPEMTMPVMPVNLIEVAPVVPIDDLAPPHPPAAQASAPDQAAATYEDFAEFDKRHWIDGAGKVMPAPWHAPDFAPRLEQMALACWSSRQLALSFLMARAAEELQLPCALDAQVLRRVNEILEAQSIPVASIGSMQAAPWAQLRQAPAGAPMVGLQLMLEALRPTSDQLPTAEELQKAQKAAAFKAPALNEIMEFLLRTRAMGNNPLIPLRFALDNSVAPTPAAIEANLKIAQDSMRKFVHDFWSGRHLRLEHCRRAWIKARVEVMVPLRDEIAPEDGRVKLSANVMTNRIQGLLQKFHAIMDDHDVRRDDRKIANRTAMDFFTAAQKVVSILDALSQSRQRRTSQVSAAKLPSMEETRRLLAAGPNDSLLEPAELLCVLMLRAELSGAKAPVNPLRLDARQLSVYPEITRFMDPQALCSPDLVTSGIDVQAVSDALAVSALFINGQHTAEESFESTHDLLNTLRLSALDNERLEILSALSCTQVLNDNERSELRQKIQELSEAVYAEAVELKKLWISCDELVTQGAATIRELLAEADEIMVSDDGDLPIEETMLLGAWLKAQCALALAERGEVRQALLAQLDLASPDAHETCARVQAYFDAGNDRAALLLIDSGEVPVWTSPTLEGRRTVWRARALQDYRQPRTKLAMTQAGETPEQRKLIQHWLACGSITARVSAEHAKQREGLQKLLYMVASGEAGSTGTVKGRLTLLRDFKDRKTVVVCDEIRRQFQDRGLNPTFLPQLADVFHKLVLMALPAENATVTVNTLAQHINLEPAQSLVVFLAPGLSPSRRHELGQGLRQRGLMAALFDDVDLCRLVDAGEHASGHDFVALLEIALEQLDLERVSPFSTQDGQHVRMETYTGRQDTALRVAMKGDYSRIFSGRKLGKSAFLQFVASNYDGKLMSSGNKLHVFFINIAGGSTELYVVGRIIDVMSERFELPQTPECLQVEDPAERFSAYVKHFVAKRPQANVLLVLDEADLFVEKQLEAYESDREDSLSFRMMKELPGYVDTFKIPRIRTILSGYRVTHTREGVWANAGDVLVLKPLAEHEAVIFLSGMLARIGVDLGEHTPFIARRCGFQPAVLIRFGERLLRRLKNVARSGGRETITVQHLDVTSTLSDPQVLEEILTVVNNNFQSNREAGAVFGATLLALKDLPPGKALTDGPAQVLAKLQQIDPKLEWLDSSGAADEAQVERYLRELTERELLMASATSRMGEREYRLRNPHFLPVLTQRVDVAQEVRKHIQAIHGSKHAKAPESVLPDKALKDVRYCFHELEDIGQYKVVVIGGQWTVPLLDRRGGIADQLGCNDSTVALTLGSGNVAFLVNSGVRLFGGVRASVWDALVAAPATKPLIAIGSMDLLRVAHRHDSECEMPPVRIVPVGRLDAQTISWWFEKVRALHFSTSDAIAMIMQLTEGIPLLVRHLDGCFAQDNGAEISKIDFQRAERLFIDQLPTCAALLIDPASDARLTARELELLVLAHKVAKAAKDGAEEFDLDLEFGVYFELLDPALRGDVANPMTLPEDGLCLEMLTKTGLLLRVPGTSTTSSPLGRVKVLHDSAMARLLAQLERGLAS